MAKCGCNPTKKGLLLHLQLLRPTLYDMIISTYGKRDIFPNMKKREKKTHEHEQNPPTFQYTGWLIGILIMVYYNPYITGQYNPLYNPTNQVFFRGSHGHFDHFVYPYPSPEVIHISKFAPCHQLIPKVSTLTGRTIGTNKIGFLLLMEHKSG